MIFGDFTSTCSKLYYRQDVDDRRGALDASSGRRQFARSPFHHVGLTACRRALGSPVNQNASQRDHEVLCVGDEFVVAAESE